MTILQLEAKLSQNPASPLFARLADEYLSSGKVQEAKALCISGLQQFPAYPTAYIVLAKCCEAENDFQSALDAASIALDHFPFAPYLLDLQVDLTARIGSSTESDEEDDSTPPTVDAELLMSALIDDPYDSPIDDLTEGGEIETLSSEVADTEIEVKGLTPLEEELRRSLDEHLHQVLDEEPAAGAPDETSADAQIGEAGVEPTGIAEFFDERISELQVEQLPEVERPAIAGEPPVEEAARAQETLTDQETPPAHEEPSVKEAAPAAADKPAYVPPPPIPDDTDVLDETTTLGIDGRIVSRTLAEIYVMQGAYAEAILTYQLLKMEKPHLRAECDARIRELEPKLQDKPST